MNKYLATCLIAAVAGLLYVRQHTPSPDTSSYPTAGITTEAPRYHTSLNTSLTSANTMPVNRIAETLYIAKNDSTDLLY